MLVVVDRNGFWGSRPGDGTENREAGMLPLVERDRVHHSLEDMDENRLVTLCNSKPQS
jgi:hypothetical protein